MIWNCIASLCFNFSQLKWILLYESSNNFNNKITTTSFKIFIFEIKICINSWTRIRLNYIEIARIWLDFCSFSALIPSSLRWWKNAKCQFDWWSRQHKGLSGQSTFGFACLPWRENPRRSALCRQLQKVIKNQTLSVEQKVRGILATYLGERHGTLRWVVLGIYKDCFQIIVNGGIFTLYFMKEIIHSCHIKFNINIKF